jgi:hypothetical protein
MNEVGCACGFARSVLVLVLVLVDDEGSRVRVNAVQDSSVLKTLKFIVVAGLRHFHAQSCNRGLRFSGIAVYAI